MKKEDHFLKVTVRTRALVSLTPKPTSVTPKSHCLSVDASWNVHHGHSRGKKCHGLLASLFSPTMGRESQPTGAAVTGGSSLALPQAPGEVISRVASPGTERGELDRHT